jgi:hypothetical protein
MAISFDHVPWDSFFNSKMANFRHINFKGKIKSTA